MNSQVVKTIMIELYGNSVQQIISFNDYWAKEVGGNPSEITVWI
jgi:hypothetical protein